MLKGPLLKIETNHLDFGLVRHGTSQSRDVFIQNSSPISLTWKLDETNFKVSKCKNIPLSQSPLLYICGNIGIGVNFLFSFCGAVTLTF